MACNKGTVCCKGKGMECRKRGIATMIDQPIHTASVHDVPVYFEEIQNLPRLLQAGDYSSVHVLTDVNTAMECMPLLRDLGWSRPLHQITMEAGESSKQLDTCKEVWRSLVKNGADRRSLLLNLGGGVVTDLGGFCAATYMRGMAFAHIPTTVLGMADAAIGGKHGVDLDNLKNYVGLFASPEFVWIDPVFLRPLPVRHIRNGAAEIIKHGCIGDPGLLDLFEKMDGFDTIDWQQTLLRSLNVKKRFVEDDPFDKAQRAALNFGHTIGHAFETFGLQTGVDLLHGEAIALGMIVEGEISTRLTQFSEVENERLHALIDRVFHDILTPKIPLGILESLVSKDKKRHSGIVQFALLESFGSPVSEQVVPFDLIEEILSD